VVAQDHVVPAAIAHVVAEIDADAAEQAQMAGKRKADEGLRVTFRAGALRVAPFAVGLVDWTVVGG
jgi:hypothetical protein